MADADVLRRIMELHQHDMVSHQPQANADRFQIKLLSAPPFRPNPDEIFAKTRKAMEKYNEKETNLDHYMRVTDQFFADPEISTFEISSNTAHHNIGFLPIVNPFIPWRNEPATIVKGRGHTVYARRQLLNVVSTITQTIKKMPLSNNPPYRRVLIVGTDQAWNDKLYQTALAAVNVDFVPLGNYVFNDDQKEYEYFSDDIMKTKQWRKTHPKPHFAFDAIEDAIKTVKGAGNEQALQDAQQELNHHLQLIMELDHSRQAEQHRVNIVAWTCSEISLAYPDGANEMRHHVNSLQNAVVVDSTQLMAVNLYSEFKRYRDMWEQMEFIQVPQPNPDHHAHAYLSDNELHDGNYRSSHMHSHVISRISHEMNGGSDIATFAIIGGSGVFIFCASFVICFVMGFITMYGYKNYLRKRENNE